MARKSGSSHRATRALARNLMLAPAVMTMRLPILAAEASKQGTWPVEAVAATSEKVAAMAEGVAAAQMSLAVAASRYWFEFWSGKTPSLLNGVAAQRALQAAFTPSGKRVRANHGRLVRRKTSP
jgi:hypothetical protein